MIYLDHNATTPLRRPAREALLPWLGERTGNPSSAHAWGREARAALEAARRELAGVLGARPSELLFTGGGTESNNLALFGLVDEPRDAHIVASPIEHASVMGPLAELERRGARIGWLPVDAVGRVRPADVATALTPATRLVTVGWANNEIGTLQPIAAIGALCRERGVPLHVDAVQAFGKVALDVDAVDLCTLSAHKLGGPLGIGALYVRRGLALRASSFGGQQERGMRPGSENVAGAVGFAAAATTAPSLQRLAVLREALWSAVAELGGVRRHSPVEECLANTLSIGVDGVRGEALVAALDLEGVAVSVGSACAAGSGEPSHVLRAIGCDAAAASAGVRFSLGPETTAEEIALAAAALRRVVLRMRALPERRAVGA